MLCTLRPSSLGLRVKFQPPHVTRHGRCLRPAPLSRGPPDGSSLGPPPLKPSSTKAQGLGRSRARGLPGRIATPGCEVPSPLGGLESPQLSQAMGPPGLLLLGAERGDGVPGGFIREPGISWASQPAAAVPRVGESGLCVCLRPCLRAQP